MDQSLVAYSVESAYVKTLVTGKVTVVMEGVEFRGHLYQIARESLEHDSEKSETVVKAELRKCHAHRLIKPRDFS